MAQLKEKSTRHEPQPISYEEMRESLKQILNAPIKEVQPNLTNIKESAGNLSVMVHKYLKELGDDLIGEREEDDRLGRKGEEARGVLTSEENHQFFSTLQELSACTLQLVNFLKDHQP